MLYAGQGQPATAGSSGPGPGRSYMSHTREVHPGRQRQPALMDQLSKGSHPRKKSAFYCQFWVGFPNEDESSDSMVGRLELWPPPPHPSICGRGAGAGPGTRLFICTAAPPPRGDSAGYAGTNFSCKSAFLANQLTSNFSDNVHVSNFPSHSVNLTRPDTKAPPILDI